MFIIYQSIERVVENFRASSWNEIGLKMNFNKLNDLDNLNSYLDLHFFFQIFIYIFQEKKYKIQLRIEIIASTLHTHLYHNNRKP
jgi:hypothetical protein